MPEDRPVHSITDSSVLVDIVGAPSAQIANKEMTAIDGHCRRFIELCPFLCLSTADRHGNQDVSPRGDPPGFVRMLDDRTLLIPDRKGNRRVDSMKNILENPNVGLVLFVPGIEEVVRINGKATLTDDPTLLAPSAVNGSAPVLGIRIELDAIFFHCAKAIKRSKLWDPATPIDRSAFPSFGEIVRDQRNPDGDAAETEEMLQKEYRDRLY